MGSGVIRLDLHISIALFLAPQRHCLKRVGEIPAREFIEGRS
jgi:hypothetical protein